MSPLLQHYGIQFPDQGSNLSPLHSELRVLATGLPGKFPILVVNLCALNFSQFLQHANSIGLQTDLEYTFSVPPYIHTNWPTPIYSSVSCLSATSSLKPASFAQIILGNPMNHSCLLPVIFPHSTSPLLCSKRAGRGSLPFSTHVQHTKQSYLAQEGMQQMMNERNRSRKLIPTTYSMDVNLSKLWEIVKDREAWHDAVYGVTKTQTQLSG